MEITLPYNSFVYIYNMYVTIVPKSFYNKRISHTCVLNLFINFFKVLFCIDLWKFSVQTFNCILEKSLLSQPDMPILYTSIKNNCLNLKGK